MATPALLLNYNRSLLGSTSVLTHTPTHVQFMAQPDMQRSIAEAVAQIRLRHIHKLGLVFSTNEFEYPFWQELVWSEQAERTKGHGPMIMVHRGVFNASSGLQIEPITSSASLNWLLVSRDRTKGLQMVVDDQFYHMVWSGDGYALYLLGTKSE